MTPTEVYDGMINRGFTDPAVLQLGDRCIIGSWKKAPYECATLDCLGLPLYILAEADTWDRAWRML